MDRLNAKEVWAALEAEYLKDDAELVKGDPARTPNVEAGKVREARREIAERARALETALFVILLDSRRFTAHGKAHQLAQNSLLRIDCGLLLCQTVDEAGTEQTTSVLLSDPRDGFSPFDEQCA